MIDPDTDILQKLAADDPASRQQGLSDLMARHLRAIKSLAWHMLGDEMMAEDIAQDTFIRAWKQAPQWQSGNAKFSTWLHRVAKNLCYDRLRKKGEIYPETLPEIIDTGPTAPEQMIAHEKQAFQKSQINAALAQLPPRQRMALTLCHYQNLSQIDAADIMEINVRAYESLLARGRKNLRQHLKPHKQGLIAT